MMNLEEAIQHCLEVAEQKEEDAVWWDKVHQDGYASQEAKECKECAEEHRQLAEWLKLLQRILDSGDCNICGIRNVCQIKPNLGEQVRYNCLLFVKEESE